MDDAAQVAIVIQSILDLVCGVPTPAKVRPSSAPARTKHDAEPNQGHFRLAPRNVRAQQARARRQSASIGANDVCMLEQREVPIEDVQAEKDRAERFIMVSREKAAWSARQVESAQRCRNDSRNPGNILPAGKKRPRKRSEIYKPDGKAEDMDEGLDAAMIEHNRNSLATRNPIAPSQSPASASGSEWTPSKACESPSCNTEEASEDTDTSVEPNAVVDD